MRVRVEAALDPVSRSSNDAPRAPDVAPRPVELDWYEGDAKVFAFESGAQVTSSRDPGNFYCEHVFLSAQLAAAGPASRVLSSPRAHGSEQAMVGFIHFPGRGDPVARRREAEYDVLERHARAVDVVATVLVDWVDQALARTDEPLRVLLTGFGPWGNVANNPTGEFVSTGPVLDAMMAEAFGARLLTPVGEPAATEGDRHRLSRAYWVLEPDSGRKRQVIIEGAVLAVDDTSINASHPNSLWRHFFDFRPHLLLSFGVSMVDAAFRIELGADDTDYEGRYFGRHRRGSPTTVRRENTSAAEAFARGAARRSDVRLLGGDDDTSEG